MEYEVRLTQVEPSALASVRKRVAWADVGREVRPLFDRVHEVLRTAPLVQRGHDVCIYHSPREDGVELEVGVQVTGPFAPAQGVRASWTPGGRAAWAVHHGEYHDLGPVHDALWTWCRREDPPPCGPSWEVYGDWDDDPAKRRTDVYLLLEAASTT